ncbi:MAG TPA: MSMEG_4193 family putative phosphomutase [Actinomycetota bacterium]|nr:MSMEG_4193 family putative phosphomutase [Actinomycetota bacterium]
MTVLLLIRHAHTDAAGKRLTGWARGVHLNERGRREAEGLADRLVDLPITAVYSSPLERCRETAAPLARRLGLPVITRRELIEVDYGQWTGRSIAGLRRTKLWRSVQNAPSRVRFPGGESLLEVQTRASNEMERIAFAHPQDTVAAVSHADVVRLVLAHYLGSPLDGLQRLGVEPASVSALALSDGDVRLLKVNDTGDLSALRAPRGRRPKVRG